ncbi:MAG: BON domain-containing protein [Pyrinomonadaceae bacterium]
MRRLIFLTLVAVSAAAFTACESTAPNTNNSRNNVNNNSNTNNITVVNNNGNANTGAVNSNHSNANVNRADYDKNKADYEKDKGSSTIGQGANDSWLWFKTRAALLATNDLRESTINVDVINDVVTLKGTVANAAQKTKAEEVAKGVEGVKSVKNELKVSATDSVTNMSTTDSDKSKTNTNTKK